MNFVFVGGQNVPGIGGVEAYMLNLASVLHSYNHDVTIICSGRTSHTTSVNGIRVVHIKCPKSNTIALPLLFFKSLSYICRHRKDIDIVNFQSIFFAFLPGWIASLLGCKPCYTIHSLAEDNPKHNTLMKTTMKIAAFISIWCCGNKLLTISKSKAKEIKSRYGKKCTIIPCGVNLPPESIESDILERFNIKSKRFYLTIGRIDPIKNLDILISAFIKRNNPEYQLVIAGNYSNKYGRYIRKLAEENKNIIFVGSVMGDDKELLLKECFVNCLVSSSEGMPISLLEAMAYGKPCIVSDIPAIREIVQEYWVNWCNVGDIDSLEVQMVHVENNQQHINKQGKEMLEYINNNHTWDKITNKYIDYLSLL